MTVGYNAEVANLRKLIPDKQNIKKLEYATNKEGRCFTEGIFLAVSFVLISN